MAKKTQQLVPLTRQDIILRGDAETIRQALEARIQIDELLEEREAAYRRISELEQQVEEIVGEDNLFPFPEPPIPVASFDLNTAAKKPAPKAKKSAQPTPKAEATTPAAPNASAEPPKADPLSETGPAKPGDTE
jgi:hypothetical protein